MLQTLRDKTSGWIATVIVVLLAIPFAFFGMEQYLFQSGGSHAARVEAPPSWWPGAPDAWPVRKLVWTSEEIEPEAFRQEFERARQDARTQQGDAFDARAFESTENKRAVLERMIDRAVLRLGARTIGIEVGDTQVRETIRSIPEFQVDGRFDPQRYQLVLQSAVPARTPRAFEDEIRQQLQSGLLPAEIADSAFVAPKQVDRMLALLGERRDVAMAMVPAPAPDAAPVSDADAQAWYEAHRADYRAPETVAIEYVEVRADALPEPGPPDEASLRTRYEQEKSRFVEADQRLVSHILVRVPDGADAAAEAAARAEAERIAGQARAAGADFAALARSESDDDGSKAAGGDLGWIEPGMMGDAFDTAVAALAPGQVSAPVKTDFGWHVLQVREVRAGNTVSFEDAREELARAEAAVARERAFNELIGRMVDQVYRNPGSLASAAKEAGLPVAKAGPFPRGGGEGIAAAAAVQRAAFSDALVQDGTVSDPIELEPGHSVLIRVTDHAPEAERPLAQVKDAVVLAVQQDRAARAVRAEADAAAARVAKGEALDAIAEGAGWAFQDMPGVQRGMPVPTPEASAELFAAPAPAEGAVSSGVIALDDGRMVVYAVRKVIPGNPAEASAQERAMVASQLERMVGESDALALSRALRQRMRITVVESRL
jgi:peptidyl-prolyl cis-trans isomerase D